MSFILLVEDDAEFQRAVAGALTGHTVVSASDVEAALALLNEQAFDLIILDIGLPGKNGYFLLSELQANVRLRAIPVICLTGDDRVADKVTAFSLGADDYLVKPCDPIELKARVQSKIEKNKGRETVSSLLVFGVLEVNCESYTARLMTENNAQDLKLTQTEFKLLCCLMRSPKRVHTRDQLVVAVWGQNADVLDRAIDVHLCGLRKKLGIYASYIVSVVGVGYKLSPQEATKRKVA